MTLAATVTLVLVVFGVDGPDLTAVAPLVPEARLELFDVLVLLTGVKPELLAAGTGPVTEVCRPERLVTVAVAAVVEELVPLLLLVEEEFDPVDAVDELLPKGDG